MKQFCGYEALRKISMRVLTTSFDDLKRRISGENKKIIVYGAGMLGRITTYTILKSLKLEDHIEYFIDADPLKIGKTIEDIPIISKKMMESIDTDNRVLLLAVSRFYEILNELDSVDNLKNIDCYLVPMLCIENFRQTNYKLLNNDNKQKNYMIPKTIHYMWLGGKPVPFALQKCIDSWKRYCPEYEIKCWNENNYDVEKTPYMKQAYEAGAYGFVPDYARIDILYQYGGIYLDTDVELVRSLDDLLYLEAFCSVEKWQTVNFGGGSGAVPKQKILGELLEYHKKIEFLNSDGSYNYNTCGFYDTQFFLRRGYQMNGTQQQLNGVTIFPSEVFHPYDYASGILERTENTFGIHHFNGGWLDEAQKRANQLTAEHYNYIHRIACKNDKEGPIS